MKAIEKIIERASQLNGTVVLPEGMDARVITAACACVDRKICTPTVLGTPEEIAAAEAKAGLSLAERGIKVIDYTADPLGDELAAAYLEAWNAKESRKPPEKQKIIDLAAAVKTMRTKRIYFGGMMVRLGMVNGLVAGSIASTGDMLRAAFHTLGTQKGVKTASSCFIMDLREPTPSGDSVLAFGDCAVIPNPTAEQLVDIGLSTAQTYRDLTGNEPRVAFLSFSTKGSAAGELVEKHGFTLNTAQGIKDFIEQVKRTMKGAMTPTRSFNHDGILTKANEEKDLFLITTPEKLERIKAQVLAGTYNMGVLDLDKFEILEAPDGYNLGTVTVDDGGGESHTEEVLSVVIDRKALPVGIRTWVMRAFDVPNTLWINNWLSIEGVIGMNGFMTGVVFTGDFGDFSDSGDEPTPPTPAETKILMTALSVNGTNNNTSLNGVYVGNGTVFDEYNGNYLYGVTVEVEKDDVIDLVDDGKNAGFTIRIIGADGTPSVGDFPYTVTGEEEAIITYGYAQ